MTREEYLEELQGLIDSFDNHVNVEDVVFALQSLIRKLDLEGMEEA